MAASLSLHIWVVSTLKIPQKLQLDLSPQGLHKCPGSFATALQLLQVYDMVFLLFYAEINGCHPICFLCSPIAGLSASRSSRALTKGVHKFLDTALISFIRRASHLDDFKACSRRHENSTSLRSGLRQFRALFLGCSKIHSQMRLQCGFKKPGPI